MWAQCLLLQVVQLFDSWAHHLSPHQFQEFSLPYANRLIAGIRAKHPNVPIIFHANGGTGKLEFLGGGACTADVLGLDWHVDMGVARSTLGADTILQVRMAPVAARAPPTMCPTGMCPALNRMWRLMQLFSGSGSDLFSMMRSDRGTWTQWSFSLRRTRSGKK